MKVTRTSRHKFSSTTHCSHFLFVQSPFPNGLLPPLSRLCRDGYILDERLKIPPKATRRGCGRAIEHIKVQKRSRIRVVFSGEAEDMGSLSHNREGPLSTVMSDSYPIASLPNICLVSEFLRHQGIKNAGGILECKVLGTRKGREYKPRERGDDNVESKDGVRS